MGTVCVLRCAYLVIYTTLPIKGYWSLKEAIEPSCGTF